MFSPQKSIFTSLIAFLTSCNVFSDIEHIDDSNNGFVNCLNDTYRSVPNTLPVRLSSDVVRRLDPLLLIFPCNSANKQITPYGILYGAWTKISISSASSLVSSLSPERYCLTCIIHVRRRLDHSSSTNPRLKALLSFHLLGGALACIQKELLLLKLQVPKLNN